MIQTQSRPRSIFTLLFRRATTAASRVPACNEDEYEEFFRSVPEFEKMLIRSGIVLIKYWFSITDDEQQLRFKMRIHDPLKQWKLSPMDMESRRLWEQYTKAKEIMLDRTHIPEAPWRIIEAVDKKKARLNCIHHFLNQIPYSEVKRDDLRQIDLPELGSQGIVSKLLSGRRDFKTV